MIVGFEDSRGRAHMREIAIYCLFVSSEFCYSNSSLIVLGPYIVGVILHNSTKYSFREE